MGIYIKEGGFDGEAASGGSGLFCMHTHDGTCNA